VSNSGKMRIYNNHQKKMGKFLVSIKIVNNVTI